MYIVYFKFLEQYFFLFYSDYLTLGLKRAQKVTFMKEKKNSQISVLIWTYKCNSKA